MPDLSIRVLRKLSARCSANVSLKATMLFKREGELCVSHTLSSFCKLAIRLTQQ